MPNRHRPPVRQMIREAVEELGSPTTNAAVRNWIEQHYPGAKRWTIDTQRLLCTVNRPSRVHYTENQRERAADDPRYDFLFRPARGQLEWYRPEEHGVWSIEEDDEGRFAISCDDGDLIYPRRTLKPPLRPSPKPGPPIFAAIPILQAQIDAASRLHAGLPQWSATDRAFERLAARFPGWDRESCILKAAAINDLYSTRVYAIWRMAEHLMHVMADPPTDGAHLVEAIASLPASDGGEAQRRHWSFASKILHFYVDGGRFPIYDSYCRDMVAYHLGRGGCVSDALNPYRAFTTNLERLRELSGLTASLRDLDRYMWLAGQYRDWLKKGADARTNAELRSLFEDPAPEEETELQALLPV